MPVFDSLLSRAQNLFRRVLTDNIVFLHIPKCGGVSVSQAICSRYVGFDLRRDRGLHSLDAPATANVIRMTNPTGSLSDTTDDYYLHKLRENLLLYLMSRSDTRFVQGHFVFSETAHRAFEGKFAFVTVLRDPCERWASGYFYNRFKEINHRKIHLDIDDYLKSESGQAQGHEYVKFLGGASEEGDYCSRDAIERAKRNLHKFDIVGFLEYPQEFIFQFEKRFRIKLELRKMNQNPKPQSYRETMLTEERKERIKAICEPDCEIYQYAVERFLNKDKRS